MAPVTKTQQTQQEILAQFDSLPVEAQKAIALSLRDRCVQNAVRASTQELFAPVNQNDVLASVLGTSNPTAPEAPRPYTGKKRGPKPGSKRNKVAAAPETVEVAGESDTDKTQRMIAQICQDHPDGINVQGIRDELVSKPSFHTNAQGNNLTALIRNCLTRAKKKREIRHFSRGLYGPAIKRGRPRKIVAEAVGV